MLYSGINEKQGGITQKYLSPKNGTLIISLKKVFYIGLIFTILFLAVGLWRLGNTLEIDMMMYIGAAESMLTWISAETYFNNELPLFAFPAHFLSSFINFIPFSSMLNP